MFPVLLTLKYVLLHFQRGSAAASAASAASAAVVAAPPDWPAEGLPPVRMVLTQAGEAPLGPLHRRAITGGGLERAGVL